MPNMLTSSTFQGYLKIQCPQDRCQYTHRFTETLQTIRDAIATTNRRREWLLLHHKAGHPTGHQ
jgi:phage FluMu protein Com